MTQYLFTATLTFFLVSLAFIIITLKYDPSVLKKYKYHQHWIYCVVLALIAASGISFLCGLSDDSFYRSNLFFFIEGMLVGTVIFMLFAMSYFNQYIRYRLKNKQSTPVRKTIDFIGEKIEEWVETKRFLDPETSIDSLAKDISTNRTYVSMYINQEYGCVFKDWLAALRLDHATGLLTNGPIDMAIKEIAYQSGFGSPSHFARLFKEREGLTPTKYRDRMRGPLADHFKEQEEREREQHEADTDEGLNNETSDDSMQEPNQDPERDPEEDVGKGLDKDTERDTEGSDDNIPLEN